MVLARCASLVIDDSRHSLQVAPVPDALVPPLFVAVAFRAILDNALDPSGMAAALDLGLVEQIGRARMELEEAEWFEILFRHHTDTPEACP